MFLIYKHKQLLYLHIFFIINIMCNVFNGLFVKAEVVLHLYYVIEHSVLKFNKHHFIILINSYLFMFK